MRLTGLRPMFYTTELQATVTFYTRILGFTCESLDYSTGWASLKRDAFGIMLSIPNSHLQFERPVFTGSIYIETDDVESLWNTIKEKVNVCYGLETFDYGMREFAIYDNNGYLLQFGQPVA
jgi:uncharacterized glyoxalase superfamily protein PhnB